MTLGVMFIVTGGAFHASCMAAPAVMRTCWTRLVYACPTVSDFSRSPGEVVGKARWAAGKWHTHSFCRCRQ